MALRRVLIQAAHYILGPFGPDSDLRRWGLRYAKSGAGNAKKRALVAVARRLAVLLLALWKSGEVYEPLRHARAAEAPRAIVTLLRRIVAPRARGRGRVAGAREERDDRTAGGLRRMRAMPTCGRLRNVLVPTRTADSLPRPHPGDRLTNMHQAQGGPSMSANRSTANTTSREWHGGTAHAHSKGHDAADGRRYR